MTIAIIKCVQWTHIFAVHILAHYSSMAQLKSIMFTVYYYIPSFWQLHFAHMIIWCIPTFGQCRHRFSRTLQRYIACNGSTDFTNSVSFLSNKKRRKINETVIEFYEKFVHVSTCKPILRFCLFLLKLMYHRVYDNSRIILN